MNDTINYDKLSFSFVIKVVCWLGINLSFLFLDDAYGSSKLLNNGAVAFNFFLTSSILFSIGRYVIIVLYNRRNSHKSTRGNFVLGINRLTAVLNSVFAVIALMMLLNIDPREFLTSMTIVAMALAVTFREYITNMISGLIVMFSEQLSVGDQVVFDKHQGRIVDITLANLVLKNEDEELVLIPNNLFFTSAMINKTAYISRFFVVRFELPFILSHQAVELEKSLKTYCTNHQQLQNQNHIKLMVTEIGGDYVKYKMELQASSNSIRNQKELESEILKEVLRLQSELAKAS